MFQIISSNYYHYMNGSAVRWEKKIELKEIFKLTAWSNPFPIWWRRWRKCKIFTWMVQWRGIPYNSCNSRSARRKGRTVGIIFSTFCHSAWYIINIILMLDFYPRQKKWQILIRFPIVIRIYVMDMLGNAHTIAFRCIFI